MTADRLERLAQPDRAAEDDIIEAGKAGRLAAEAERGEPCHLERASHEVAAKDVAIHVTMIRLHDVERTWYSRRRQLREQK